MKELPLGHWRQWLITSTRERMPIPYSGYKQRDFQSCSRNPADQHKMRSQAHDVTNYETSGLWVNAWRGPDSAGTVKRGHNQCNLQQQKQAEDPGKVEEPSNIIELHHHTMDDIQGTLPCLHHVFGPPSLVSIFNIGCMPFVCQDGPRMVPRCRPRHNRQRTVCDGR